MGHVLSRRNSSAPPCWSCSGDLAYTESHDALRWCKRCGAVAMQDGGEAEHRVEMKKIRLKPFSESLPESEHGDVDLILNKYIRPYLHDRPDVVHRRGDRLQVSTVDFRITMSFPPSGFVSLETSLEIDPTPIVALTELTRLSVVACAATLQNNQQTDDLLDSTLMPYFTADERLLCLEDTFIVGSIQFKVVHCVPECGRVTSTTRLFCESDALPDLSRVHILPIYESLPNREKDITEQEIYRNYLRDYFRGYFRYLSHGQEFEVKGVNFKVVGSEPRSGIVTLKTTIYARGRPLQTDDIRQQQLEGDAEMARRLQYEESNRLGWRNSAPPQMINIMAPGNANNQDMLQRRINDVLARIPSDNQMRPMIVNLQGQNNPQSGSVFIESLLQHLMEQEQGQVGAAPGQISQLPTRTYTAPPLTNPQSDPIDAEQITCRICLSIYEEKDLLRTLPCFHVFHAECVDRWLATSSSCPICKNPIS